jgi:hypothetical protein
MPGAGHHFEYCAVQRAPRVEKCSILYSAAWLPHKSNQKSQFGRILDDIRMENVEIFYNHFGIFYVH